MTQATYYSAITINLPDAASETQSFELLHNMLVGAEFFERGEQYSIALDANGDGSINLPTPDGTGDASAQYLAKLSNGTRSVIGVYYDAGGLHLTTLLALAGTSHNVDSILTLLAAYELALGNPDTDGYILSSTTAGVRSWVANVGGGLSDGDKGDITVSGGGATWTIDAGVVTYAKMQDVSATARLLGRNSAGAGDVEELSAATVRTMLNVEDGATADQSAAEILTLLLTVDGADSLLDADLLDGNEASAFATAAQGALADSALQPDDIDTLAELNSILGDATLIDTNDSRLSDARVPPDADYGDITVSASGATWTIDAGAVTYAKMQDVSATARLLGRNSAGAGDVEELSAATVRTMLNVEDGATADQSAADIRGLGFFDTSNDGASSGLDADLLDGNHASAFATASHAHATTDVTSGTFADARISESSVTQHEAALTITESQISDLDHDALKLRGVSLDATVGSPSDGSILVYRTSGGDWVLEAKPAGGSNPALAEVTDVTLTAVTDNEVLAYDNGSGEWINQTAAEAGLATAAQGALADSALQWPDIEGASLPTVAATTGDSVLILDGSDSNTLKRTTVSQMLNLQSLDSHYDVTITAVGDGELLVYDSGISDWINQTIAEAGLATAAQGALADSALQSADIDTLAELNAILGDATLIDTNDSRLSDARTPTAHAATHTNGTDDIQDATAAQKGLMTIAYASKLDGIEALADVTDTANVTAAGALMDSEVDANLKTLTLPASTTISTFGASLVDDIDASTARTTLGLVIGTDVQAYSAVLAGTTASFTTADETKLDGIETAATADQTAADIRTLGFFDTSNDGTGSGLDADLLDGNHATAFFNLSAANTQTIADAATTSTTSALLIRHNSSGTPGTNFGSDIKFQLESTTTENRDAGRIAAWWITATDASRKGVISVYGSDSNGEREFFRGGANGSAPIIGFLGSTPVAQQSVSAAATDLTTVVALANSLRAALISFGLCA